MIDIDCIPPPIKPPPPIATDPQFFDGGVMVGWDIGTLGTSPSAYDGSEDAGPVSYAVWMA